MPDLLAEALLLARPEYQGPLQPTRLHLMALRGFYMGLIADHRKQLKREYRKETAHADAVTSLS